MKNKDLNTYMNEKLDQGDGLRYQEEYWNDMSTLLDAQMPVATTPAAGAAKVSTKLGTTGLKWILLSSTSAALITAAVMYVQFFRSTPSTPVQQNQNNTIQLPSKTQTSSENPAASTIETPSDKHLTEAVSPESETTTKTQSSLEQITYNVVETNHKPAESVAEKTHTTNSHSINEKSAAPAIIAFTPITQPSSEGNNADNNTNQEQPVEPAGVTSTTQDESVETRSADLILIGPLMATIPTKNLAAETKPVTLPYHHPNRFIRHAAVSPFIGIVAETGTQSYQSGNMLYTHPSQTNYTYGVNLECETKWLSFRTGIGYSNSTMHTALTSATEVYDVDTHYVILNPNYGSTQSGKPVALIQRNIDSSYVSTKYTTTSSSHTYQYVYIPFTLQYHMAYNRFAFILEGGVVNQILVSKQQSQPAQSEKPVSVPTYNLQLTAGSSLRYAIDARWAVGVQYNYNLNPYSATLHLLNNAHVASLTLTRSIR
jgi:hypothetical protein